MQSDRWIEKGDFRSETKSGILTQSKMIPIFLIEQSDPHIASRKSTFSTGCADRIAHSKNFLKPPHLSPPRKTHPRTAPMLAWLLLLLYCCCCCCCSQRLGVAHPVLRPPAARTVIRWQQCVLSMTFWEYRQASCCSSDEDVLEHSKQLIADALEPTSRTRSSFEPTFTCPTPAYQTPPERTKQKLQTRSD